MIFDSTPYFIIIFEVLISAPLPWIVRWVENKNFGSAALIGLAEGVWMWLAVLIGWAIAGPLP